MAAQTLYLMVGYPGSGKTTASKIIEQQTNAVHLWADHERKKMFAKPTYSHEENLILYDRLNDLTDQLLGQGKSIIYDTSFNFYQDRQKLRAIANKHNVECVLIWVVTPKHVARERATQNAHKQHTRVLGDFSVENFERMADKLEPPRPEEHAIELDGTNLHRDAVLNALQNTI